MKPGAAGGGLVGLVRQCPPREVVVYYGAAGGEDEITAVIEGSLGACGTHDVPGNTHQGCGPWEICEEIDKQLAGVEAYLYPGVEAADNQIEVVDHIAIQEDGDHVSKFGQVGILTGEGEAQSNVEVRAAGHPDSLDDFPEQA